MNRHDIIDLQARRSYPSISILMPTHRTSPANKADPILLKNLVTEVEKRLAQELSKREIEPLMKKLEGVIAGVEWRHTLEGLALYVSPDYADVFYVPVTLNERVVIDETFATRDLVLALNRSPRYWVLALSEQPTKLFEGARETLIEARGEGFPMVHGGPGGSTALPKGQGISKSAYEDERHRQFFKKVDDALSAYLKDDPLPVVVVGVERWLSHFNGVTANSKHIVATVTGNHDKTPAHELGKLVWPPVSEALSIKRQHALDALGKAVGAQRYGSGPREAWRYANEGRVDTLIIEEDFHFPATLDQAGLPIAAEDSTQPGVMDDAMDEVIEKVLALQGNVVFVDNDDLEKHQYTAVILRY